MIGFVTPFLAGRSTGSRTMTENILPERVQRRRSGHGFAASHTIIIASLISLSAAAEVPCPPKLTVSGDTTVLSAGQSCPGPQAGESDTPDYADPMLSCQGLDPRRAVNVASASALQQALTNANCGDTIRLAPGTYDGSFVVDKTCPMTAPVIIQGAPSFGSRITSSFKIGGARTIVSGLDFSGPVAQVSLGGTNNKVLANRFKDWRGIAILATTGKQGEIAYNELSEPHPWLASEADSYPLRIGIRTAEKDSSTFHFGVWVHDNYFHDFPGKPDPSLYHSGQSDAIEVCQTNREWTFSTPAGWYIERNLIRKHLQGYGVVDLKCSGVVVRANTVTESPGGRIDIRAGVGSTLESNWQETGGTTVNGGNHRIIGNIMREGGIALVSGNLPWNTAEGASSGSHNQAYQVLVAGNETKSLIVGVTYQQDMEAYPATRIRIEGHKGSSPTLRSQLETSVYPSTIVRFVPAFMLSPGDVGPSALNGASPDYLKCRRP